MVDLDYVDDIGLEFEEDEYLIPDEFYGTFHNDVKNLAADYIVEFFTDRSYHCGGPITKQMLRSPRYVNFVLNLDIENATHLAYIALEKFDDYQDDTDIKLILSIYEECSQRGIPKCFAGGIMLVYLQLCKGVELEY